MATSSRYDNLGMGWLRHVLTVLSVILFLLGCLVIGYIAWVMATSLQSDKFVEGSMIWTYCVITIGCSLFFTGLMGWVGGASKSPCLVRMFLGLVVMSLLGELGGVITLKIFNSTFEDILERGWFEVNQGTRNIVQHHLECCGWKGLEEFARNNDPIDETCYENLPKSLSGIQARNDDGHVANRRMKADPCSQNLADWLEENKIAWVTVLAVIVAIQVMSIGISVYILMRINRIKKFRRSSRANSKRQLYDSFSESSGDHQPHHHHHHHHQQHEHPYGRHML